MSVVESTYNGNQWCIVVIINRKPEIFESHYYHRFPLFCFKFWFSSWFFFCFWQQNNNFCFYLIHTKYDFLLFRYFHLHDVEKWKQPQSFELQADSVVLTSPVSGIKCAINIEVISTSLFFNALIKWSFVRGEWKCGLRW